MGLYKNILNEPVSTLSLREVIAVDPATTVRKTVEAMREKRLGCVVVADPTGKAVGMFTESELIALLSKNAAGLDEPVSAHLAEPWASVRTTDPISRMLRAMQSKDLRFVCVVDREGRAVATTGQKGLMEYIAEHFPEQVQVTVHRVGARPYDDQCEGA